MTQHPHPNLGRPAKLASDGLRIVALGGISEIGQVASHLSGLLAPQSLTNNEAMAKLLADAIGENKKFLVIGDYDADGATATAVAVKGLRIFGANVSFLVPNRFEYGYGLTPEIVALAATQNPDVIITVDNGIASVDGVNAANALGMQVLITDHHLPGQETPQAACIINPNQQGCTFASKNLAGVGVMFYALLALRAEMRERGVYANTAGGGGGARAARAGLVCAACRAGPAQPARSGGAGHGSRSGEA